MKKNVLLLTALIMMGTAQNMIAQQRKQPIKRTVESSRHPVTKKPTTRSLVTSIPMEGPAFIDEDLAYLGIPLSETVSSMKAKLKEKGLKSQSLYDGDEDLYGIVGGTKVRVNVQVNAHKGCEVRQYDTESLKITKATTRFQALLSQLTSIYGQGKYKDNEKFYKKYHIKTPKGTVIIELFNEDEMDGSSDCYLIAVCFTKNIYD